VTPAFPTNVQKEKKKEEWTDCRVSLGENGLGERGKKKKKK